MKRFVEGTDRSRAQIAGNRQVVDVAGIFQADVDDLVINYQPPPLHAREFRHDLSPTI